MTRQRILRLTPYLLLAPGILWLAAFYVYPAIQMFISSFWTGSLEKGFTFSLGNWTTYTDALVRYQSQFLRSLVYGAAATVICFIIAYPLAYG
ncbi:MAG: ABC transporter permease, partial [Chloroflexota bacterium]